MPEPRGNRYSVYLSMWAIVHLENEIQYGQESSRDLSVPKLVAKCVEYVITKDELKYVTGYLKAHKG